MKTAQAILRDARISFKQSMILSDLVVGKKLDKAKSTLENLIDRKTSLQGKFYPKTASKLLEMLTTVEANAKVKKLDTNKLYVKKFKADKGIVFMRPRSRFRLRARRAKSATLELVVEER